MPPSAVFLFVDATTLRWFPPLRFAWAFRGEQARVRISGQNAKRVLFGAIDPRRGTRVVVIRRGQRQEDFQAFLHHLRRHYRNRPIWLLLDKAAYHIAARSRLLALQLGMTLLWMPKQCPELNPMDHIWKELKRLIAANRQFKTIDVEAHAAERWLIGLTTKEALRKAGILSPNFWLKAFL